MVKNRSHVWIVGLMGSGKSTTGKALAEKLLLPFTDSDEVIAAAAGKRISELFDQEGEAAFRGLEEEFVATLQENAQVVACGGGLPCYNDLIHRLLETGTVVYLRASVATLTNRLVAEPGDRPLLRGVHPDYLAEEISRKMVERSAVYELADLIVDVDGKSVAEIVAEIAGHAG